MHVVPPLTRILVIGADSADPELIERWGGAGDLPNLMALKARSAIGRVDNPPGIDAGSAWATFHSGLNPGRHPQYEGMRYFDPASYEFVYYKPEEATVPVYRELSRAGRRCFVMDAPFAHLERGMNGTCIVDWGAHDPAKGPEIMEFATEPADVAREILDLVGPDPCGGTICDDEVLETIDDYKRFMRMHIDRMSKKGMIGAHFLAKGGWDYFEIVFCDPHCLGHHVWHINDKGHPRYRADFEAALGEPLREGYRALDAAVGKILSLVDERTLVVFYASHGIGPQYTGTGLLDRILYNLENGVRIEGSGRTLKGRLRAAWRSIPPDLRAKVMPIKRHFNGALRHDVFVGEREKRKFFEVYATNRAGGVRINLKGREARGLVDPKDYDALLEQISADLREIVNVESGEPLVEEIIKMRDHYHGAHAERLPDLTVAWNRNHPIRIVGSPKIGTMWQEYADSRTGDHRPVGLFYASGSGVQPAVLNHPVTPVDFAPTFRVALGLDAGESDGVPIRSIVASRRDLVGA
jgi:predicted AlkP superfamily phosphohydrolase/phosphomutase